MDNPLSQSFHDHLRDDLVHNRTCLNIARKRVQEAEAEVKYWNDLIQKNKRDCLKYGVDPNV